MEVKHGSSVDQRIIHNLELGVKVLQVNMDESVYDLFSDKRWNNE